MPLTFTPQQMDALIQDDLDGYALISHEITDHEDDGRLYRHVTFSDSSGQSHTFNYMWSPWDGNDYTIFASAKDEVQIKAAPPTPVAPPVPSPAPAPRAPVTHTLADVQHLASFQEEIVGMYRRVKFGTPSTTIAEAKTLMRDMAERHGLSDRDVIDAVHDPRTCGIRPPKTATEAFTFRANRSRRRPG